MDAEDYSSSGAKFTWRLINKASIISSLASHMCHPRKHACEPTVILPQEVRKQAQMSAPLAADLVLTHSLTLISLAWVAQLGTQPLAAAALAAACYTMLGRLIISGLCGALDTQAAQVLVLVPPFDRHLQTCSCALIAASGRQKDEQALQYVCSGSLKRCLCCYRHTVLEMWSRCPSSCSVRCTSACCTACR